MGHGPIIEATHLAGLEGEHGRGLRTSPQVAAHPAGVGRDTHEASRRTRQVDEAHVIGNGSGIDARSLHEEGHAALLLPDSTAVSEGPVLAEGLTVIGDEQVQAVVGIPALLQCIEPALKAQVEIGRAAAVQILEGLDLRRTRPGRGYTTLHALGHGDQTRDDGVLVLGERIVLAQARARCLAHVVGSVHGVGVHQEEQGSAVVPVQQVLGALQGVRQTEGVLFEPLEALGHAEAGREIGGLGHGGRAVARRAQVLRQGPGRGGKHVRLGQDAQLGRVEGAEEGRVGREGPGGRGLGLQVAATAIRVAIEVRSQLGIPAPGGHVVGAEGVGDEEHQIR